MKVLKKQGLTFVLVMALVVTLTLGIIFMLPAKTAVADDFTPDITVGTEAELTSAITAAQANVEKKIQLTQDMVLSNSLTVDGNRNIVLDLNGHKLSQANYSWVIFCQYGAKLTLVDGRGDGVITNEKQSSGVPLIYNYGTLVTSVNLTVPAYDNYDSLFGSSPAIMSCVTGVNFATQNLNKPSVTVKGGTLMGPAQGSIISLIDSNLTVEGGTFVPNPTMSATGESVQRIFSISTLTLRDTASKTLDEAKQALQSDLQAYASYRGSEVKVTGGDFTAFKSNYGDFEIKQEIQIGYLNSYTNGGIGEMIDTISVVLDGESRWGKNLSDYTPDGKWMELYDPSMDFGTDAEKYYIVSDASEATAAAVVTVGQSTRYCSDFDTAFAFLGTTTADRTLKLCKDATAEQLNFSDKSGNITLDLNGKKLTIERRDVSWSGHVYFDSNRKDSISLTVKDGTNGGELILFTPSGATINTYSCFSIGPHVKFTLESGTIRQTGYFESDYNGATYADYQAPQAIFHLSQKTETDAVTIKGGNIVSDIYYGTEENHGELTSSPYLVSWANTESEKYELNFETGTEYPHKTEIFKFDLTDYINAGKTSVFSWNFKAEGDGAAQWTQLGNTFNSLTFSGYGKDFMISNFTDEDHFLASDGKTYGTLKDAVDAKSGSNYYINVLQHNLTVNESVTLDGITLDLDRNRNFTLNLGAGIALTLKGGASLLNGKLNGSVAVAGNATLQEIDVTGGITIAGDVTLQEVTVAGSVKVDSGTLTILSGEYSGEFTFADGADAVIKGGTFKGSQIKELNPFFAFTLGAYIEAGHAYNDNELYEVKIAPNLAAQAWYNKQSGNTYEIASTDEWNYFALYVSSGVDSFEGKTVKLTADLDFGHAAPASPAREAAQPMEFLPAGNHTYGFNGTFDGGGNTIKGINVTERNAALFGGTGSRAIINNITVENSVFTGGSGYFDVYNTEKGWVFVGAIIAQGNHGHNDEKTAAKGIKIENVTLSQKEPGSIMGGGFIGQTWSKLYVDGIEINGLTLDGSWKMGGIVGFTEENVTVIGAKVTNFKSTQGTYVGAVAGQILGKNIKVKDSTIIAKDDSLFGTLYASANAEVVIEGPDTYIEAEHIVTPDDKDNPLLEFFGLARPKDSKTKIQFSSEVEDNVVHRTTVILGKGSEEQQLELQDSKGQPLPEESMPKPDENGVLNMAPLAGDDRIKVTIGGITLSGIQYNAEKKATVENVKFTLYYVEGGKSVNLEQALHGELKLSVTLELSECNVGKRMALITSYNFTGDDAKNFNFQLTGNQTFIEVEVTAKTLQVSVNGNGEVEYNGFVGGEDESVLGGELTLDKVDNGDGTYTVTPSGLESENYNIVYVSSVVPATAFETESNALWIALAVVGSAILLLGAVAVVYTVRKRKE